MQISGLPPGDLARVLSRALDALRQLGNLPFTPIRRNDNIMMGGGGGTRAVVSPGIHPEIRNMCRAAARSINRYPLKDPLAFAASDDDGDDDEDEVEDDEMDDDGDESSEPLETEEII